MRTGFIVAAMVTVIIGSIVVYAIWPYFTSSSIDEDLPEKAIMKDLTRNSSYADIENKIKDQMFYEGIFVGVNDGIHNAEGSAKVIPLQEGSSILRLESFESTNGPDLYVYLSTDKKASDHISLGRLKANAGNQNYEIPHGVDLERYDTVLIWCKAFGVLFGSADLK